ncbi:MAG: hypothetical protein HRT68_04865 [Flavobacteriaceae bacterium]|nr:hypothetical protein [Flavobacteriaceae bacterium]
MNKAVLLLLSITLLGLQSCKEKNKENPTITTPTKEKEINCDTYNKEKEVLDDAVYSFEKDASKFLKYTKERSNSFFLRFLHRYSNGNYDFSEMVTENSINSYKKIKNIESLYYTENGKLLFNFNSEYYTCMYSNFSPEIKTVFDQLEESGYLNTDFTAKSLNSQDQSVVDNEYIKSFIVMAIYYPTIVNNSVKVPVNLN